MRWSLTRRLLLQELLASVATSAFAVATVKTTLVQSTWTDLGAGPLLLRFNGDGVYAIGDATPTIPPGEGFAIRAGKSVKVMTTSHVWATSRGNASVSAYVAPVSGGAVQPKSVWSAADAAANGMTLSNGGLTVDDATELSGSRSIRNTISKSSGKVYIEFLCNSNSANYGVWGVGSSGFDPTVLLGSSPYSAGIYNGNTTFVSSGFVSNYTITQGAATNDVWALAVDFTTGSIWIARNSVWFNASNPATGLLPILSFTPATVGPLFAGLSLNTGQSSSVWTLQSTPASQKYLPPPGFQAWDGGPVTPSASSVWSAADAAANSSNLMTLSNGNLTVASGPSTNTWGAIRNTISHTTGKVYVEFLCTTEGPSYFMFGLASAGFVPTAELGTSGYSAGMYNSANSVSAGFTSNYSLSLQPAANDVWALAVDFGAGSVWLAQNNVWQNGSNPATALLPILSFVPATVGALFAALEFFEPGHLWTLQPTAAVQTYAPPSGFTPWG
jgi:hypothetical protein